MLTSGTDDAFEPASGFARGLIISVLGVAVATLLGYVVHPLNHNAAAYGFFFLAVAVVSQTQGFGPGVFAIFLSLVALDLTEPSLWAEARQLFDVTSVIMFIIVGVGFCTIGEKMRRSRLRLEQAKRRFAVMFDKAGVGMLEVDVHGRIIAVNEQFCRILNAEQGQLLGKTVGEITDPEDRQKSAELNRMLWRGEITGFDIEKRYITHSGSPVWVHLTASSIRDAHGVVRRCLGTVEDITERKRVEEALKQSEAEARSRAEELAAIMDADPAFTFIARDRECREMEGSRATRELLNIAQESAPDEQRRPTFKAYQAGRELETHELPVQRAAMTGLPVRNFEFSLAFEDGSTKELLGDVIPLLDHQGQPRGAVGSFVEITQRKRMEEDLTRRNAELALLRGAAEDLLLSSDSPAIVEDILRRAADFMGAEIFLYYAADDLGRGMHLELSRGIDSAELAQLDIEDHFEKQNDKNAAFLSTDTHRRVDELIARELETKQVRCSANFPLIAEDRFLGLVVFASCSKDSFTGSEIACLEAVSRYVALAQERVQTARALESASAAKDEFIAVLSHELRTPLTPVLAAVSLMQVGPMDPDEVRELAEVIQRNVRLEARLIDDLLDLTRIVRGKVAITKQPVDLKEVIQRAVDVCRSEISQHGLQFSQDLTCARCTVNGDSARLQQVFWNLLTNAVKFTPQGGSVRIVLHENADSAVIEVSDSGIGVEREALPHIFEAFAQASHGIERQFGGLGLGLAIARRIVEMHGGSIVARSKGRNLGTTIRVELPLLAEDSPPETRRQYVAQPSAMRILLVEDHADTAKIIRAILESVGHSVTTTADATQAFQAATTDGYDLLISDLGLPGKSGLELMRDLREAGKPLKAIALTGFGREEDLSQSKQAGFIEHLTKPVEMEALLRSIERTRGADSDMPPLSESDGNKT